MKAPLQNRPSPAPDANSPTTDCSRRGFLSTTAKLAGGLALYSQINSPWALATEPAKAGFQRRGFYLHGSWVMNHPFGIRTWSPDDFRKMFRLLRRLGFTTVMIWPMPECAPMPLSQEDADMLGAYRAVIDDARQAGLECWLVYCPNVILGDEVRHKPWSERSLYAATKIIKLDDEKTAVAYLEHRRAILRLLDNADALVVIDGDPGGYPGAPIGEYLRILKSDQQVLPKKPIIPWLWNGWGRDTSPPGGWYWTVPVAPLVRETLAALKKEMTGEWELLPGRSRIEGWANGREPVAETEKAGLMSRSTIMCYEAIEFEPTPPASVLQFDIIRRVLRQEGRLSGAARGVMGNCQNAVLVLPNLYYFSRGATDPGYLDKPEREVLADLARELGDTEGVLIPAWSCLKLSLTELPADLAGKVRALRLDTEIAQNIPGGPQTYVEIIAAQVESRRRLLVACSEKPATAEEAAESLAEGAAALIGWWLVHRYVGTGRLGDTFQWGFINPDQVEILRVQAKFCATLGGEVFPLAAGKLKDRHILPDDQANTAISDLLRMALR